MVLLDRGSAERAGPRALLVVAEEKLDVPAAEAARVELEGLGRVVAQEGEGAKEELPPVLHRLVRDALVLGRVAPVVLREDRGEHEAAPPRLQRAGAQIDRSRVGWGHRRSVGAKQGASTARSFSVSAPFPGGAGSQGSAVALSGSGAGKP